MTVAESPAVTSAVMSAVVSAFMSAVFLLLTACVSTPRLEVGPVPAGVSVDARLQYYDISAASIAEIQRAMLRDGVRLDGRTWGAATNWNIRWTYQYAN